MKNFTNQGTVLVKKGSETHANTSRRLARRVCSQSVRAIRVLTFAKFVKCAQYTALHMALCMHIGIYTVRELRDNTVTMGLRFCLHEVVAKNRNQLATFFLTSTVIIMYLYTLRFSPIENTTVDDIAKPMSCDE